LKQKLGQNPGSWFIQKTNDLLFVTQGVEDDRGIALFRWQDRKISITP
jgi:hypothetical protein